MRAEFLVDFERSELAALDRFFVLFDSPSAFAEVAGSVETLSKALHAMQSDVRRACDSLMRDADAGSCCVHLRLDAAEAQAAAEAFKKLNVSELDLAFGDPDGSTDASVALWKMLDVIGPIDLKL